ncbi:hypothetical protein CIK05_02250 [Bdellovibrio sp. qaytius]|nr:hypothetical protein CIK05_02250 [Bdellovibrio sp. qaytius]
MTKTTRLGPFNELLINEIKEKLDRQKLEYKIDIDADLAKKYQDEIARKGYGERHFSPTTPLGEFMFIEVNQESLFLIKKFLYDMGVSLEAGEYIADNELFCPVCDFGSNTVNVCPTHGVQMVDYYKSKIMKKQDSALNPKHSAMRYALIVFVLFAVTVLAKKGFH